MAEKTPRLNAPYIISTQSQKEVTHNDALNILDALVQTVVETSLLVTPPLSPAEGELWIVGGSAADSWLGHDNELAQYIGTSWKFYMPFEGLKIWLKDENIMARYVSGIWQKGVVTAQKITISGLQVIGPQQGAIGDASGGAIIDNEARSALNSLLATCRLHGLIAL